MAVWKIYTDDKWVPLDTILCWILNYHSIILVILLIYTLSILPVYEINCIYFVLNIENKANFWPKISINDYVSYVSA